MGGGRNGWNGWKWLEMDGMAGHSWKWLEWLEIAGNDWKWLEMT